MTDRIIDLLNCEAIYTDPTGVIAAERLLYGPFSAEPIAFRATGTDTDVIGLLDGPIRYMRCIGQFAFDDGAEMSRLVSDDHELAKAMQSAVDGFREAFTVVLPPEHKPVFVAYHVETSDEMRSYVGYTLWVERQAS